MGDLPDSTARPRSILVLAAVILVALAAFASACGSSGEADVTPAGEFPVRMTVTRFPSEQRLAGAVKLKLGVENVGTETIPELSYTITTDDGDAAGSFNIQLESEAVADPNRPVWILESGYPREVGTPPPKGTSGGLRAQTNSFAFGRLKAGEEKVIVWRVTPVRAGTYTLNYEVAASLDGRAEAVTRSGGAVKGDFLVTISDKPEKQTVNEQGKVVPADKG